MNDANMNKPPSNDSDYWLDQPRNINKLLWALAGICVLLLFSDLVFARHGVFGFEHWFGFFAWFGFISYCFIVLSAKQLRRLLRRDETYYDD